jgi:hypothetical protein
VFGHTVVIGGKARVYRAGMCVHHAGMCVHHGVADRPEFFHELSISVG